MEMVETEYSPVPAHNLEGSSVNQVMNLEGKNYDTKVSAIAVTMETIRTSNMSVSMIYKIRKRQRPATSAAIQLMLRYLSYLQQTADVTDIKFDEEFSQLRRKWTVNHSSQPSLPVGVIGPEIMNRSQGTSAPGSSIPYHASPGPPAQFQHTELSPNWEYALIF
ncbi:hypothetical protein llap_9085 [Limosa lapponica baueri]|uniref:Uncharacterized protein n=1 Tax=Limosa lapponica baueri TaxID=1758121 RepID=A0A2I0U3L7_LIMLA|nr:hypothetical protein llap_9085 [Limosa lapponica baueri]